MPDAVSQIPEPKISTLDELTQLFEDLGYTPSELDESLTKNSSWIHDNIHKSRGCIGCEICSIRSSMETAAVMLGAVAEYVEAQKLKQL